MDWISLIWVIPLGLFLLALTVMVGYACGVLGSIRNSLNSARNTLQSIEGLVDKDVRILLEDVDGAVKEINKSLPELLENVTELTASLQQISKSEIEPTAHNIQQMTDTINRSVAKIDELIGVLTGFSQETVERAEYYRDQLSVPLTDIISLWSGIKAGLEVFSKSPNE